MTLDQSLTVFRKWLWLILLTAIVAGGISYFVRRREPPIYKASTIMAFGDIIGNQNPDPSKFGIASDLANTYSQLVFTDTILNPVVQALKLPINADGIRNVLEAKILTGTTLLELDVTYNDPIVAANLANEIANQLLKYGEGNADNQQEQQIKQLSDQIQALNNEISQDQDRLNALDANLNSATSATDIADFTAQRNVVAQRIETNRTTLAQDNSALTPLLQNGPLVKVYEPAQIPINSQGSDAVRIGLEAAGVAASITIGIILLITYFENFNVRAPADIAKTLDLPVLATVSVYGKRRDKYSEKLVTHQPLRLEVMESYRLLHTRLVSIAQKNAGKAAAEYTFIITSPAPGDGKSVISANLAVTAALFGLRVLLMDADLRNPSIHKFFGLPNETGMAKLLSSPVFLPALVGEANPSDSETLSNLSRALDSYLQYTDFANLIVLTSGPVNEGSARDLGILFRPEWLATLKACTGADVIIMDTPPCLAVADSSILAAKTNASVILVLSAGKTPVSHAIKAKAQFTKVGANIEGFVLNMADPQENEFDYKYPMPKKKQHA